jgi:hypothetical protein
VWKIFDRFGVNAEFIEKHLQKISSTDFIEKNSKKISTADFIEEKFDPR